MDDAINKRVLEIQDTIRHVLNRDWNPMGDPDLPEDEYDRFIIPIYQILTGSRSVKELAEYLFHVEQDVLGLEFAAADALRPVARKLMALDVNL